ncbi:MAG: hypothetical protein JNJ77_16960 [Planctomycetia bacterium]|nr:hypothetical protein [Planctomycetia bacterium]
MSRKRSRVVKLALLGTASLLVGGCGGCDDQQQNADFPNVDPILARKAVAAGTGAVVSDAFLQAAGMLAAGPGTGLSAPLNASRLGYVMDQAVETADVTRHESGLAKSTQPGHSTRSHYRYHHGPGIGWFLWGYMLSRSTTGTSRPYSPPSRYSSTPRPYTPSTGGGGRSFAGGSSSGRSSGAPSSGGSVSRGGFGSSGGAHASGGSS